MGDIPFHMTGWGRIFFDRQLPALIKALEGIGGQMAIRNEREHDLVLLWKPENRDLRDALRARLSATQPDLFPGKEERP